MERIDRGALDSFHEPETGATRSFGTEVASDRRSRRAPNRTVTYLADDQPGRRGLLYLALNRWHGQRQRTQHIAAGLARTRPVVFVEPAAYSVLGSLRRRLARDVAGSGPGRDVSCVAEGLQIYRPRPGLPWSLQLRMLNRLVHRSAAAGLRRVATGFPPGGVDAVVAWPPAIDLARQFRPRRLIYDCMDLFPEFVTGLRRRLLETVEQDLAREASAVVVASRALERRWRDRHPRVVRIPNGVDWPMFRPRPDAAADPADVAGMPRPRLGYVGTVARWLDLPLLVHVARKRPAVSIILVGPMERDITRQVEASNVHFLGERPYASLPEYLAAMDVLLIPFRLTPLTQAVNPIKFYEYCASGKPIVATALEELEAFTEICHLGRDPDSFVHAVDAALREAARPDPARTAGREAVARANTWEERVAAFAALVDGSG